ncbi:MAG: DUF1385 domain-containing protein, partial [Candidatus Woesearchaeota archaeon]
LIEGVLIRTPEGIGIANRLPDSSIKTLYVPYQSKTITSRYARIPFVRGIVVFFETLYLGVKYLSYSSELQEAEKEQKEIVTFGVILLTLLVSLLLALFLFKFVPLMLAKTLGKGLENTFLFNLLDGMLRLAIFLLYLGIIAQSKEAKQLFSYHAAEHMTIHAYEQGTSLTVSAIKQQQKEHPRCGTAFVLYSFVMSIVLFSFIPPGLSVWETFFLRLPLLFPIIAISYELILLAGKKKSKFLSLLLLPGIWLQHVTTRQPQDEHLEVAIAALKTAISKK